MGFSPKKGKEFLAKKGTAHFAPAVPEFAPSYLPHIKFP